MNAAKIKSWTRIPGAVRLVAVLLIAFITLAFYVPSPVLALSGQLNINRADTTELQLLPFTGTKRAQAIVNYRKKYGPFESLDEVLKVPEIGPSTFEAIKPYLKLAGPTTLDRGTSPQTAARNKSAFNVYSRISTRPGEIQLLPNQHYFDTLVNFIRAADQQIDMAMFLFKTTKSPRNKPAKIMNELIAAQKRGVRIRVVLEKSGYDESINEENNRVAQKLRRNGVAVHFDSEKVTSHMKLVVIDARFCFLGSHNLTHSALTYNNEYSLLIDNAQLANELLGYIGSIN